MTYDRMDGNLYLQILNGKLQENLEYYGFNAPDIIFQQDDNPKHIHRMVKEWLEVHEFKARPQSYPNISGAGSRAGLQSIKIPQIGLLNYRRGFKQSGIGCQFEVSNFNLKHAQEGSGSAQSKRRLYQVLIISKSPFHGITVLDWPYLSGV